MPELPEVETIARQLGRVLPGKVIQGIRILDSKLSRSLKSVVGFKVVGVRRHGKQIYLSLQNIRQI